MRLSSPARRPYVVSLVMVIVAGCSPDNTPDSDRKVQTASHAETPVAEDIRNAPLPHTFDKRAEPRPARETDWFEDKTASSGIDFAYRDGNEAGFYTLLETVGGGVGMIDYDQDGDLDLYFTGGGMLNGPPLTVQGRQPALFRNDGNWKFTDVTQSVGLNESDQQHRVYTHGVAVGDYNNDGLPDLAVTGYGKCRLFRNENGSQFVDVSEEAGIVGNRWYTAAAWLDMDQDGDLDLYAATYCKWTPKDHIECTQPTADGGKIREPCAPSQYPGDRDSLWQNHGDGTFEDVAETAGLTESHRGLGVLTADFDQDGRTDIFVANDVDQNDLYFGNGDGTFTNEALRSGVAFSPTGMAEGSMGVEAGDVDGDGLIDLFYTNFVGQDNSLYRSAGDRIFLNAADRFGILGISRLWVGFGTALCDFDGDGWQDLFVANGHVFYGSKNSPYYQPQQLLQNQNGKRFENISNVGGPYFSVRRAARGTAAGDLDNDGDFDLVVVHQNEPPALLQNRKSNQHWVRLQLHGTESNRDAIGTRVSIVYNERTLTRWVRGGAGYLSSSDYRILFPRADETPATVTVHWPTGRHEQFSELAVNQTHELVEGRGKKLPSSEGQ
ncbi:CRTAC1 family protein [Thalassoroseus pseudoceratinae]|uniref:CRTAC1 family protein n=1 Tax=Thalassoroseus pseudoceratinae TaxID=2713176 RepID=UPI00142121F5|nr:CRTAC1 family protein [Thalassoroseus pseudoceratinae]